MLTVAVMVLTNELRSRMSDSASFAGVVGDAAVRIHQAMVHYNPESCWYGDKPQHASNSDQDSKDSIHFSKKRNRINKDEEW